MFEAVQWEGDIDHSETQFANTEYDGQVNVEGFQASSVHQIHTEYILGTLKIRPASILYFHF